MPQARALHFDVIDTRPTRRVALMIGGRMIDEGQLIDGKQWITRTARQTSKFLIEYCGGDNERLTWLVAKIRCGGRVRTEAERSDLLGLCVLALQTRNARRKATRELMLLREQSRSQGH